MKRNFYLGIGAIALFALASCEDDLSKKGNEIEGGGIVFGATAGYGDPETRTIYGDKLDANGNVTGDFKAAASQKIEWVEGDAVEIYSPTSPTGPKFEYGINNIGDGTADRSKARLVAPEGVSLQWATGDAVQDFYAVYPAKRLIDNVDFREMVSFEGTKLVGFVPVNQVPSITKGGDKGWTVVTNMDYSYMVAKTSVQSPAEMAASNQGVNLDFRPLTTTLEITLVGPTTAPISAINIVSTNGTPIAGSFSCDMATWDGAAGTYPDCEYQPTSSVETMVTISTYYRDGEDYEPLKLGNGEEITFNVFLLPHDNLENLQIRVAGLNVGSRAVTLSNEVKITPHKKTCVKYNAPTFGTTNTWMTSLNKDIYVSQLSIPGTANSFSYNYSGGNPDWYKTQTADIEQQWNAGVRCFELRGPNSSTDNLADAQLQCNRTNLGITFGAAVEQIWNLVEANPGEFAMIMPAFESDAGRGGNVTDYANDLNNFISRTSGTYKYVTYGRDITLDEARGSLMVVARITSEEDGADVLGNMPRPVNGVFIDQWGSLKDNWARRGYTMNGSVVANWAKNSNWGSVEQMEYYMINGNTSSSFSSTLPQRVETSVDFVHTTTRTNDEGQAYVQDWQRVVRTSQNIKLYDSYNYMGTSVERSQYAYWQESFVEKKNDVWETFEKSIADNSGQQGTIFYINSLDGYFVDEDIQQSYIPYVEGRSDSYRAGYHLQSGDVDSFSYGQGGMAGNIGEFASAINDYFYDAIITYGTTNIYGPMNVVILDRVLDGNASTYLPQIIIDNNFRFRLVTGGDSAAGSNYDGSYANGGLVY